MTSQPSQQPLTPRSQSPKCPQNTTGHAWNWLVMADYWNEMVHSRVVVSVKDSLVPSLNAIALRSFTKKESLTGHLGFFIACHNGAFARAISTNCKVWGRSSSRNAFGRFGRASRDIPFAMRGESKMGLTAEKSLGLPWRESGSDRHNNGLLLLLL